MDVIVGKMQIEDQDVNESLESSGQEQEQQQSNEAQEGQEAVNQEAAPPQEEKRELPFHEHPRFKELIEQKNQFKQQVDQYTRQMADMERRFAELQKQNTPKPQDALMERLKGIDPEFADRFGKLNKVDEVEKQLQEFNEWRQEQAQERVRMEARSSIEKLFSENNVPKEMREIYEDRITAAANRDPNLGVGDLPRVFKSIHDQMSSLLDRTKRETTKSYVTDKSATAQKPSSQPKGKAPAVGKKAEFSKDPAQARAEMVKQILAQSKAEKDI